MPCPRALSAAGAQPPLAARVWHSRNPLSTVAAARGPRNAPFVHRPMEAIHGAPKEGFALSRHCVSGRNCHHPADTRRAGSCRARAAIRDSVPAGDRGDGLLVQLRGRALRWAQSHGQRPHGAEDDRGLCRPRRRRHGGGDLRPRRSLCRDRPRRWLVDPLHPSQQRRPRHRQRECRLGPDGVPGAGRRERGQRRGADRLGR